MPKVRGAQPKPHAKRGRKLGFAGVYFGTIGIQYAYFSTHVFIYTVGWVGIFAAAVQLAVAGGTGTRHAHRGR
ncbi:hypothetical protein GCM10027272_15140 [Hymenobacter frigidus]